MKRQVIFTIKIFILAALLVGAAFLMKDSSDVFRGTAYSVTAPTDVKFDQMKRWLPDDPELVVVVDPHRLFANEPSREFIAKLIEGTKSIAGMNAEFIAHVITSPGKVGMVAAALELSPLKQPAEGLLVVQGDLDDKAMIAKIKEQVAKAGVELSRGECGGVPLYVESTSPAAFAVAFPDKHHMLLGSMTALERIMRCDDPTHTIAPSTLDWYPRENPQAVFGRILITPRIASIFPHGLKGIRGIRVSMGTDYVMRLTVPCASSEQAMEAQLFFEGVRVSLAVTSMNMPRLAAVLMDTKMNVSSDALQIAMPLKPR